MNKSLAIIQYMVDSGDIDITQLYTIFKSFGTALPIIPCLLQRGQRIVRVRINKDFDSHYTHLTQLSYPPAACASLQRASLPGNPLFYGSVFTHSDNSNHALPRIVTLYETCEEIRDKTCATRQKMTFSIWECQRDLHLFALPFATDYERPCNEIKLLQDGWRTLIAHQYTAEQIEFVSYMGKLMAIRSTPGLYEITANFINYIFTQCCSSVPYEGVVYPTVQLSGDGMNVAIKPDIADSFIKYQGAIESVLYKTGEESILDNITEAVMDPYGTLHYDPINKLSTQHL